jgi:hypothetical protein
MVGRQLPSWFLGLWFNVLCCFVLCVEMCYFTLFPRGKTA